MGKLSEQSIVKNGVKIKKATLLFTGGYGDSDICDGCDEAVPCACINTIGRETIHLCKDCVIEILESF